MLAVEIISPTSARTDTRVKRDEYAGAGIGDYWLLDLDDRVRLTACHLAGEFGYVDSGPVVGTFVVERPFPVTIVLDRLVRR